MQTNQADTLKKQKAIQALEKYHQARVAENPINSFELVLAIAQNAIVQDDLQKSP